MRKQYIRRVKRALCLSEEEKQEMIRDLQEIFDSAVVSSRRRFSTTEEIASSEGSTPKDLISSMTVRRIFLRETSTNGARSLETSPAI